MEMLVTLVLISFATMLMFQMLGSYRIARERVGAQAAGIIGVMNRMAGPDRVYLLHGARIAEQGRTLGIELGDKPPLKVMAGKQAAPLAGIGRNLGASQ